MVQIIMDKQQNDKITVRAKVGAVKTHGPNSPDVLSGKVPLGFDESIETEGPQLMEVDYEQAVELFGRENADQLFAAAKGGS